MERYKLLLIAPTILLIFSVAVLVNGYSQTGEWFARATELKGGSVIELKLSERADVPSIEAALSEKFDIDVRELSGLGGYGLTMNVGTETDPQMVLAELKALGINTENPNIQTIGPALGEAFWVQAQIGIILAFIGMGIVVFLLFRQTVPALASMACVASDILTTIAFMQIFGVEMSLAGFAALLMMIGYSVDSDILQMTRITKGTEDMAKRQIGAVVTGLTMSMTSLGALLALLIFGLSTVITEIAIVLIFGLIADMIYTWMQNSVIIRWYNERGLKHA